MSLCLEYYLLSLSLLFEGEHTFGMVAGQITNVSAPLLDKINRVEIIKQIASAKAPTRASQRLKKNPTDDLSLLTPKAEGVSKRLVELRELIDAKEKSLDRTMSNSIDECAQSYQKLMGHPLNDMLNDLSLDDDASINETINRDYVLISRILLAEQMTDFSNTFDMLHIKQACTTY